MAGWIELDIDIHIRGEDLVRIQITEWITKGTADVPGSKGHLTWPFFYSSTKPGAMTRQESPCRVEIVIQVQEAHRASLSETECMPHLHGCRLAELIKAVLLVLQPTSVIDNVEL